MTDAAPGGRRCSLPTVPGAARRCAVALFLGALAACVPGAAGDDDDAGLVEGGDGGPRDVDGGNPADDAGQRDAGPRDAGPRDAGGADDAGPDPQPDAGTGGFGPYDTAGAASVTRATRSVGSGLSGFDLEVFIPSTAGPRPVVSLSPGLLQPATAYVVYGERLASHGIITLIRDDPGIFTNTADVAADIEDVMTTWLAAENADPASPLFGRVDPGRLGLAGHSRGGKASLVAAGTGLRGTVDAWFGLDPVDASEFSGGVLARDTLAQAGIPTVFFGAEIASACSPAGDSYTVLFPIAPTPSVKLTALGGGHTQLQDEAAACVGCAACTPEGTADAAAVLRASVRYLTAFFARELNDDASVGAGFDGAGVANDIASGLITRELR